MASTLKIRPPAESDFALDYESARDWYGSYGWCLSTRRAGDVEVQAVKYDWLDGKDVEVVALLRAKYAKLTRGEAEAIVEKARSIREAAEAIEAQLALAVAAYQDGDVAAVVEALDEAEDLESPHGDTPASRDLRAQLLEDVEGED